MALKECPTCKTMIRASAERCRTCGQTFEASTLVKTTAPRCPLCGQLADAGAGACDCGYDFSTRPIDLRAQLVRRKRHGAAWIAGGLILVLGVGAGWFFGVPILFGVVIAAFGAWMIARGIRSISWTRGALAELAARDKALPAARVVERD